jgi:FtsZ-interacting cell division protein ZipA
MYLLLQAQTLSIEGWHLALSTIAMIITFIIGIWRIDRARKKDFKDELDKKADIVVVESHFLNRDEKINTIDVRLNEHEKNNNAQFTHIKEGLEEVTSRLDYSNSKIDRVHELLINKI